jgi:hypothetical protein
MDPLTALAAFAPVVVEAGKAAVSRWLAPAEFKPASVEQWLAMKDKEIALFNAINAAGGGTASYPWVEAIVRLQRPFVVACVLVVWAWSRSVGVPSEAIDNAAAIVGFYLFGDRTLLYARRAAR